jgi:hypothetical protein
VTPLTPTEINDRIWSLMKRCDEVIREIYKAGDEYADAKTDYEDCHSKEVLRADGTVQEKKAIADGKTRDSYKRFVKADVRYKYLKTVLETTRAELSAAQSIGSNMRDEWAIHKQYKT